MTEVFVSLLGICIGMLAGVGAGRLIAAGVPLLQQISPLALDEGPVTLVLLALVGAVLGMLVGTLFDHPSVLLGALVALLYCAHRLLRPLR